MADDGTDYETRTVRTVRGTESRTASKWEKEGWVVVSQSTGRLQTELTIRRPKPRTRRRLYAVVAGAVIAVAIVAGIVTGVIRDRSAGESVEAVTGSIEETTTPNSSGTPSAAPTPAEQTDTEAAVLTTENDADLAAVLNVGDPCDSSVAAFAEAHRGQTIAFDGSIAAVNSHDGATTRYDILIGVGDSPDTVLGPTFQFRDVNTTNDLRYVGDVPDTLGVGTNLNLTARVDQYEPSSCLFLLQPVETVAR